MNPEQWRQIEALYSAALARPAPERAAFLDEACAHDPALRQELASLLAHDNPSAQFITALPAAVAAEMLALDTAPQFKGGMIRHYRVLSRLGRGGWGEVYLALDTQLGRKVAIKLLPPAATAAAERVRRFAQEARAASALSHPNIVTIHEIGTTETAEGEAHYIVSEFVAGETLRALLTRGSVDINQAVAIAEQLAQALNAAHAAGIIHRDIKPENVMLRPDGLVKVLDFGIAKLTERDEGGGMRDEVETASAIHPSSLIPHPSTSPGVVLGTVHYMSPEQARGLKVDARTDLFSLGVVLYEMLSGRRPFAGATASDVLVALLREEPPPLAGVPAALERIVAQCLAKERTARYASAQAVIADLQPLRTTAPRALTSTRTRQAWPRWLPLAALVVVLLVGTGWLWFARRAPAVAHGPIKALAVLPLANLSGEAAQEYFADGMTDALIGDLAKLGGVQVISRTTAMHYKGTQKTLPQIADELKVDALIEGTVQRAGERVRIRVQLVNAATDAPLWAESYERDVRDVMALQGEVAQTIARAIQTRLTPAEQTRLADTRPVNREAFDAYLLGRQQREKWTEAALRQAIEHLQRALAIDANYAPAYAELARCYNLLGTVVVGVQPPLELRRLAREAASRALALDGGLVEAHLALGYVKQYEWDWRGAETEFKQALELSPNSADAHYYWARYLTPLGRLPEALAAVESAQRLDPLSIDIGTSRAYILLNARRYDEAIVEFNRVLAREAGYLRAYWHLGHTYMAQGQYDAAIQTFEQQIALGGRTPSVLGFLSECYGLAGRKTEARRILNELLELQRRRYVTPPAIASAYIGLGDKDQAFAWLEKAYQERSNFMAYLKVFPLVDPLRDDPRFAALVRRIGLTP